MKAADWIEHLNLRRHPEGITEKFSEPEKW